MSPLRNFSIQRGLAATLVFVLAMLVVVPATACTAVPPTEDQTPPAAAAQSDLIALLPQSATTIGYIDFATVRQTEFYAYLNEDARLPRPDDFEELIAETGIDPRTDVHRVAFSSDRTFRNTSAFLVQATFDRSRVESAADTAPTAEYGGFTLYQIDAMARADEEDSDGGPRLDVDTDIEGWMVILNEAVLGFGNDDTLRAIIDVAGGSASARDNTDLMRLLEDVDADSNLWMVSAQEGMFSEITPGDGMMGSIGYERINALIASIDLSDGIRLRLRGRTGIEEDAKNLGDALNGMVALGKMMLQNSSPEVFAILDRIETGSRGRDVTIFANLTMEDLRTLREYAEEQIGANARQGQPGN